MCQSRKRFQITVSLVASAIQTDDSNNIELTNGGQMYKAVVKLPIEGYEYIPVQLVSSSEW